MGFHKTAIIAFSLFFITWSTIEAVVTKPENSLAGPYIAGGENLAWWDLTGSAQLADSAIRLTTDEQEKQGAIWNNFPNILNEWELHIQIHIHGKGVHLNGDGMAIWYVREPLITGPVFGYKDIFSGLGLFIDTVEDPLRPHHHKHPYISVVINNGTQHYEHDEEGTVTQIGGCHVPIRNLEWPSKIAISYISQAVAVFTDAAGTDSWSQCFISRNVQLPTGYYFGVSASTGVVTDNHDVISITTLDMSRPDKPYEDRTHVVPHAEFVQIPARPRFSEEVSEEQLQKEEVKREVHQEEIVAEVLPAHETKDSQFEKPKADQTTSETEPEEKPASFWRKAIYIAGIGVLLYVAIAMYRQYSARRKERIQKRLY